MSVARRGTAPLHPVAIAEAIEPPAFTCTSSTYVEVTGSRLDTQYAGSTVLGVRFSCATQNVTVQLQGSMDGSNWTAVRMGSPSTGSDLSSDDIAVTTSAAVEAQINPAQATGARSSWRHYRLVVKYTSTTGGVLTVVGGSK